MDTGDIGEVWSSARTYDRGDPPPGLICGTPRGSAEAWAGVAGSNGPFFNVGSPECEYNAAWSTAYNSRTLVGD